MWGYYAEVYCAETNFQHSELSKKRKELETTRDVKKIKNLVELNIKVMRMMKLNKSMLISYKKQHQNQMISYLLK